MPTWDLLGLGCASIDEVLYVDRSPGADGKAPVRRRERAFGGLVGMALMAASRLGGRCAYAGRLGPDPASRLVEANLQACGIDVSHAPRRADARVVEAVIVVAADPPGRAIFYQADGAIGPDDQEPAAPVIAEARVLLLDHYNPAGGARAARSARQAGVGVVADLEGAWDALGELLPLIDHLVCSREAAARLSGAQAPEAMLARLWHDQRALVCVTDGAAGCWWRDHDPRPRHQPAFAVEAVDTTGCGDVFHGAYALALARGLDAEARIRFASAAAALKATRSGGAAACPDATAVDRLLAAHPREKRGHHAPR